MNRFSTSLVWYHRNAKEKPAEGNRIVVHSPDYKEGDPLRTRIIDSQFFNLCKDAEWWAYINIPE